MKTDLNDLTAIKKLDKSNVANSIEQLALQCEQALSEVSAIKFPNEYKHAKNIVFSGMGGSALGAYTVKSLFLNEITVPYEIVNDYRLPGFVDDKTLVVVNSYSGSTEETLVSFQSALDKKSMIFGSSTGGKLANLLKNNKLPSYIYSPKYNISNQPRMGIGYSVFVQIALLANLGYIKIDPNEIVSVKNIIEKNNLSFGINVSKHQNLAKRWAEKLFQKIPVIITAEFLTNAGRVIRNQFNENAKQFAAFHDIPELNHHLMEGLMHPAINKELLHFIFFISNFYSAKTTKRVNITQDVVGKNGIITSEYKLTGKTKISQVLETIHFMAYVNYYLALLYGIDPSKIPWVDYFKAQLAK